MPTKEEVARVQELVAPRVGIEELLKEQIQPPTGQLVDTREPNIQELVNEEPTGSPVPRPTRTSIQDLVEQTYVDNNIPVPVRTPKQVMQSMIPEKPITVGAAPEDNTFMGQALRPLKELPQVYREEVQKSLDLMAEEGVLPKVFGGLGYLMSPITAVTKSLIGNPARRAGAPEWAAETLEGLLDLTISGGIPGTGKRILTELSRLGTSIGTSRVQSLRKLGTALQELAPASPGMTEAIEGAKQFGLKLLTEGDEAVQPLHVVKALNKVTDPPGLIGAVWGNFWNLISVPFTKRIIPTYGGRKSIQEILQPAVDRLYDKGLDVPFRIAAAKKQLLLGAGRELGNEIKNLPASARFELGRALKEGVAPTSKQAAEVYERFINRAREFGIREQYIDEFREALADKLKFAKLPEEMEWFVDDIHKFLKGVEGSSKNATKALIKAVGDTNTPEEYIPLLIDLVNLPAATPEAVARASRKVARNYIISGLRRLGAVSDEAREGWEIIDAAKIPAYAKLGGKYVPRDVWLELKALNDIPKISRSAFNTWFMSPWKTAKVILRPATHVRNVISNLILNDLGGLPFYDVKTYYQAFKELRDKGKYYKEFRNLTGSGGAFTEFELAHIGRGLRFREEGGQLVTANMFDRALELFNRSTAGARELYNADEQLFKVAKYIKNRTAGMDKYDAAIDAMKWTFNYGEVTPFTATMRAHLMPFFTWQSKILPLMAQVAKEHPLRLVKWIALYQGIQQLNLKRLGINEEEFKYLMDILPEHIANQQFLFMPFRDDKGRLQLLNMTYMLPGFGDINEFSNNPLGQIFSTPFVTIGGALASNTTFTGQKIWFDWEAPSTKLAKGFEFVWRQLMPSWVPYGTDSVWDKIHMNLQDHPEAPTWYQILGQQFGFKIHAIDEEKAARGRRALTNIRLSELQVDLTKKFQDAVKRGKSDEDLERMAEHYLELRRQLLEPREPSGLTALIKKVVD